MITRIKKEDVENQIKTSFAICYKHGIEKINFWSISRGGVIHGCPLCDNEVTK